MFLLRVFVFLLMMSVTSYSYADCAQEDIYCVEFSGLSNEPKGGRYLMIQQGLITLFPVCLNQEHLHLFSFYFSDDEDNNPMDDLLNFSTSKISLSMCKDASTTHCKIIFQDEPRDSFGFIKPRKETIDLSMIKTDFPGCDPDQALMDLL